MFEKGDVIRVSVIRRIGFGPDHYGIYDGNGGVYHYVGDTFQNVKVKFTSLDDFANGSKVAIDSMVEKNFTSDEIINRAIKKLGSSLGGYNLKTNNCEHFANWCSSGIRKSRQTVHVNKDDDKRDFVEKKIDETFEPLMQMGDTIDKLFGWGDHKK